MAATHPTIAPRNLAVDLKATLVSVTAGGVVAAAITLGLGLLLRYTCYQAILHAGGSQVTLSGTPAGIFVPDNVARPAITAWVIGYDTSIALALVIGVAVGARVATRTIPQAITILSSPGDAASHAKMLFRCISRGTATTLITLVLTLAVGVLVFITAVLFPAAVTALAEALPLRTSPGPAVFSGPAILVGIATAMATGLLAVGSIDRWARDVCS